MLRRREPLEELQNAQTVFWKNSSDVGRSFCNGMWWATFIPFQRYAGCRPYQHCPKRNRRASTSGYLFQRYAGCRSYQRCPKRNPSASASGYLFQRYAGCRSYQRCPKRNPSAALYPSD
jgi:hypothetical protein